MSSGSSDEISAVRDETERIRGWLGLLPKADFQERGRIVEELRKLGGDAVRAQPGSIAALLSLLEHADPYVRLSVARAMGRLDVEAGRALAVVMQLVESKERNVHQAALHALVDFSAPPEALTKQLVGGLDAAVDVAEVYASKMALIAIGGPAIAALCRALEQGDPVVRRRSAAVLGGIRERYAGTVTVDPRWRRPWAHALPIYATRARGHLTAAIRALLVALRDDDDAVRRRAAEALGCGAIDRIPEEVLGEYLDVLLSTRHPSARFAMADAFASEKPAVVAAAARRWSSLDDGSKIDILRCVVADLDAVAAAERAIHAVVSASESPSEPRGEVNELLRRLHEERALMAEDAETERLLQRLVRGGEGARRT